MVIWLMIREGNTMHNRVLAVAFLAAFTVAAAAQSAPERQRSPESRTWPYTRRMRGHEHYYTVIVARRSCPTGERAGVRYALSPTQYIEVLPLPPARSQPARSHGVEHGERRGLRKYLAAKDGPCRRTSSGARMAAAGLRCSIRKQQGRVCRAAEAREAGGCAERDRPPYHPRRIPGA